MFADLDDATVDALLSGAPTGDAALAPLEDVVGALRSHAGAEPAPAMTDALSRQLRSSSVVPLGGRRRSGQRRRTGVAAAAAVAIFAVGGTAAAQNRLPASVQDAVSSTAGLFGLDIERSDERGDTPDPEGYEGTTTPGGATPAEPNGGGEPATPATPPDHAGEPGPPSTLPEQAEGGPDAPGGPNDAGPPVTTGRDGAADDESGEGTQGADAGQGTGKAAGSTGRQ